jgi:hypothetical protein
MEEGGGAAMGSIYHTRKRLPTCAPRAGMRPGRGPAPAFFPSQRPAVPGNFRIERRSRRHAKIPGRRRRGRRFHPIVVLQVNIVLCRGVNSKYPAPTHNCYNFIVRDPMSSFCRSLLNIVSPEMHIVSCNARYYDTDRLIDSTFRSCNEVRAGRSGAAASDEDEGPVAVPRGPRLLERLRAIIRRPQADPGGGGVSPTRRSAT